MNIRKLLLIMSSAFFVAILGALIMPSATYAENEKWYWDDQDIRVSGGYFGGDKNSTIKFTTTGSGNLFTQQDKSAGESPGSPGYKTIKKGTTANPYFEYEDVSDCLLQSGVRIEVDRSKNTLTIKEDSSSTNSDNSIGGGKTAGSGADCSVKSGIKFSQTIGGKPGQTAEESSQADTLADLKDIKKEEYVAKKCPLPRDATRQQRDAQYDCSQKAKQAFDIYWGRCANEGSQVAAGATREAKINDCLIKATGIGIQPGSTTGFEVPDYEKEPSSCGISGIGYIVCPLMRFMAKLSDLAFGVVQTFLVIQPLDTSSSGGSVAYNAWKGFRDIANVAFVIAFMVIVYSQLTGSVMTNYSIKRLLPRIIVAAILMNISYYLCVVMVDLSNIIGASLKGVVEGFSPPLSGGNPAGNNASWEATLASSAILVPVVAGGAAAAVIYGSLAMLVPILTTTMIAFIVTAVVLVARYGLIILLVIVSPLAFVAYLLPNTQKWFGRWSSTFMTLLILYPLISLLYGGAHLAAATVFSQGVDRGQSGLLPFFALGIQAIPLVLTPFLIKLAGGVLNRFGAVVTSKGPLSNVQKKADGYADFKRTQRDLKGLNNIGDQKRKGLGGLRDRAIQRRYKREAVREGLSGEKEHAEADYVRGYMNGENGGDKKSLLQKAKGKAGEKLSQQDGLAGKLGDSMNSSTKSEQYLKDISKGGSQEDALNFAIQAQSSAHSSEVSAAKATILNADDLDFNAIKAMATSEAPGLSSTQKEAAIEIVLEQGDVGDLNGLIKSSGGMNVEQRAKVVRAMQSTPGAPYMADSTAQNNVMSGAVEIQRDRDGNEIGNNFAEKIIAPSIVGGDFSADSIAGLHPQVAAEISKNLADGKFTDELGNELQGVAELRSLANDALDQTHTRNVIIGSSLPHIESIAGVQPGPAPRSTGAPSSRSPRGREARDQFWRNR